MRLLECAHFVFQGPRGHARGRLPPGRVHRRVNNGRHSGVLRLSTAGELTAVDGAAPFNPVHLNLHLCRQKNSEMSNVLVVESDNSAQMSEVQSRSEMDTIAELQEEED